QFFSQQQQNVVVGLVDIIIRERKKKRMGPLDMALAGKHSGFRREHSGFRREGNH
ncbi:hypothetical protein S245_005449, partial [Arachis hypogaea]